MNPMYVRIAKIITGLILAILASIIVYEAISSGIIYSRGHSASITDSPESFYFMIVLHGLMMVLGLFLAVQGWRDSGR